MRAERFDRDEAAPGGITPVILCGGAGTRLWPLSQAGRPKPFLRLTGERTPFEDTLARLSGPGFGAPVIVAGQDHAAEVAAQCGSVGAEPLAVLLEPSGRNTAPAALAAAVRLMARDPAALMLISPADHAVEDAARLRAAVRRGLRAAASGRIVAFGAEPLRAETGYGWLEPAAAAGDGVRPLRRFIEKPDAATARRLFCAGGHLWNMGLFLCRADALVEAFRRYAPDILALVSAAMPAATRPERRRIRLASPHWDRLAPVSLDVAVMEKAANLSVVPFRGHWTDLGDWNAVAAEAARTQGSAPQTTAIGCTGTYLRSDAPGIEVVGIGLTDIVAVAAEGRVLIAHRSQAQAVRAAAAACGHGGVQPADTRCSCRPWGQFSVLDGGAGYKVKRLAVAPGARLSLQSHRHRAEHWVLVAGSARVTVDGSVRDLMPGESVHVPVGAIHRLENPGAGTALLIEVQTGPYLEEDDIRRYADDYARCGSTRPPAMPEPANVII